MGKSEFGKGLVVCLLYFANHWSNDMLERVIELERVKAGDSDLSEEMKKEIVIWGSLERLIHSRVLMWANGATDHLYEIEVPEDSRWDGVRKKVVRLKETGLKMRYESGNMYLTYSDIKKLFILSKDIAIEIDELIGLHPDLGEWQ